MVEEKAKGAGAKSGARILKILRWVAFAGCVLLFIHALAKADLASAWGRIEAVGPIGLVVLLPFLGAMGMDAWAWQGLLAALDRRVRWVTLWKIRIATEALTNSAPGGGLWADAVSPLLVSRQAGIPATDVFAASTAKRWSIVRVHAGYVTITAALAAPGITKVSRGIMGSDALLVIVLTSAVFLLATSIGIEMLAARGRVAGRVSGTLGRARFVWVKKWIEERRHHFVHADTQLARLSKDRGAQVKAAWRLVGLWLFEGFETFLILRLLGAPLGFVETLAFDASFSVVRSLAVFAPAGIGVQDVGFLAVLQAYGVPDAAAIGPAFIVMKRMKEAFWVTIGFVMLARSGPGEVILHPETAAAQPPEPQEPPADT